MEFKDKIRDRRKELGMSLEDVGNLVGVGKSTVRKWETGYIENMRRDKIAKLAAALKTTPAYLMGWEEEKEAAPMQISKEADEKLGRLLSAVTELSDDNWKRLMDYVVLLKTSQSEPKDNQ